MMSFWDTVLGNRLAEVLIRTLPELTEKLSKKEQYGTLVPNDEVAIYIDKRLQDGERFITSMPSGKCHTYVIMEEK